MEWFHYLTAALQTLAEIEPAVAKNFHGGAANTASKVGSALAIVAAFGSALNSNVNPGTAVQTVVDNGVHPELESHAQTVLNNPDVIAGKPS